MSEKTKIELEYDIYASPSLIFRYVSTPFGLSEWFADNVRFRGEKYTFIWDDTEEHAVELKRKTNQFIRYQWLTEEENYENYYFEFRIDVDAVTKDVLLVVTDFVDQDDIEESELLWNSLIQNLKSVLGST
ncbi:MAG: START-like domain-containing protein [Flavobacteriaceae bacterium]|nr:START-like domain-containing protein [Flavobacteriaceae bacterium]MCY4266530.1 START-like domain-containing protein [Flavobacteriaceae bacterium]MCY4299830.1 START-like domain-containing protein [Flavobacteriaceae bacterium]